MPRADDPADGTGATRVTVTVNRTGGIAGIPRGWRVRASDGDARFWRELVERCPWDDDAAAGAGADRFVWEIVVIVGDDQRRADLPEERVQGPWRELVDAVRDAGTATRPGSVAT